MSLLLVRHAQPLVTPGTCYGRLDLPADDAATRDCAERLASVLPDGAGVRVSSLQRCEQLAQRLSGLRTDLIVKTDARLQEMHFGAWEGRAWAAIPRAELDAWTDDFAHHRAGGHGESVHQFMVRVGQAWDDRAQDPAALWITHAGVIRAATLIAQGQRHITLAHQWPTAAPAFGQWVTLEASDGGPR